MMTPPLETQRLPRFMRWFWLFLGVTVACAVASSWQLSHLIHEQRQVRAELVLLRMTVMHIDKTVLDGLQLRTASQGAHDAHGLP